MATGIKKIISLSKIFIKDYYQNLYLLNNKTKKINKKSTIFWLIIIILIAEIYLSQKIIKELISIGYPEIFLNIFFPILAMIIMFQVILVSTNIFFYSKDIEYILPLPIKPVELLLSKFNTLLSITYISELIFAFIPICMYGILNGVMLGYYFCITFVFLLFPIFLSAILSTIMLIIMKFSKFIKNKEVFQVIVTLILIAIIWVIEINVINNIPVAENANEINAQEEVVNINNKFEKSNNYFLVVNPCILILENPISVSALLQFIKLILIDFFALLIFIGVGKITYLKNILKSSVTIYKNKNEKINIEKNIKKENLGKLYVKKEFKLLLRNASFFIQCIFPAIILLITILICLIMLLPNINGLLENEEIANLINDFEFNSETVVIILGLLQVFFTMTNISLTAVSRDGKCANFMKYIPVELYKQFVYKAIPQIFINLIITAVTLGIIYFLFTSIGIINIILIFIIATLINMINSYLMLVTDLLRPRLNWDSEFTVVKKSDNKIFQYVLMIVIILFLLYLAKIFKDVNLYVCLISQIIIFGIIFACIDRAVKINQKKLFKKIN